MDLLVVLASRPDDLWLRSDLIDRVWGDGTVTDESLTRAISVLRKALLVSLDISDLITTVPKLGYRLNGATCQGGDRVEGNISTIASGHAPVQRRPGLMQALRVKIALWPGVVVTAFFACVALISIMSSVDVSNADMTRSHTATLEWPAAISEQSVVVMPFSDISYTGAQSYFSQGLSDDITRALANVSGLHVVGRASAISVAGDEVDSRAIGEALQVAYILDGEVRKVGNKVQINTHLIRADNGLYSWSGTIEGRVENVFDLQESLVRQVIAELGLHLDAGAEVRVAHKLTHSVEAYDLFLRARAAFRADQTEASFLAAERLLREAVLIDPDFAYAWLEISTVNRFAAAFVANQSLKARFEASRFATAQANAIAPADPQSIISSAYVKYHEGDALGAFKQAKSAWSLQPGNAGIAYSVGHFSANFGYLEDAKIAMEEAVRLDPRDAFSWSMLALINSSLGEHETALIQANYALELGDYSAYISLIWATYSLGDSKQAEVLALELFSGPDGPTADNAHLQPIWEAWARAVFRNNQEDATGLRGLLRLQMAQADFQPDANSINLAAQLGMAEVVFAQWDATYTAKSTLSMSIWADYPWAKTIRQHPDFKAFTQKQGLVATWQEFGWPDKCQPHPDTDGSDGQFECT